MNELKTTVWGIHAGRTGDADNLFLEKSVIALGWDAIGNLIELSPDRESFKRILQEKYPSAKMGAIPVQAGQLYRFVHEIKVNDLVVYPSKNDKQIHLGKITGDYKYDQSIENKYPHRRAVKWLKSVPRTSFTQGGLYEIGSAMSLFQVKNYAEEFLAAVHEESADAIELEDESSAYAADEIEQLTKDFILKRLAQELKGHPFASFVADLLNAIGYKTRVSPEGPDGGVDIVAHKDPLGLEPPIIKVQVKSTAGNTSDPDVSALYGKVGKDEYGMFISLGGFTPPAKNFARSKSNLRLIGGEELVDLVLSNYDKLDPKHKAVIPLRKVYIQEDLADM